MTSIGILTRRVVLGTAGRMAEELRALGYNVICSRRTNKRLEDFKSCDILIRWGNNELDFLDEEIGTVINRATYISNSLDYRLMYNMLQGYREGSGPPTRISGSIGTNTLRNYVIRHRWTSSGGRGIINNLGWEAVNTLTEENPYSYITIAKQWFTHEVRVLIAFNKSISMKYKRWDGEGPEPTTHGESNEVLIRSADNGWTLMPLSGNKARDLGLDKGYIRDFAKNVARTTGLDIVAVDIGVKSNGTLFCIEINTAPGLNESGTHRLVSWLHTSGKLEPGALVRDTLDDPDDYEDEPEWDEDSEYEYSEVHLQGNHPEAPTSETPVVTSDDNTTYRYVVDGNDTSISSFRRAMREAMIPSYRPFTGNG